MTLAAPPASAERDVARPAHATVGPDVSAEPSGFRRALDDRRELRAADARHHARRAHGSRADTDLDDVGAGFDELSRGLDGHDVAGDDRNVTGHGPDRFDGAQRAGLMTVSGVDHEDVDAELDERLGLRLGVGVDADGDGDHQPPVGVECRSIGDRAQRAVAGHQADEAAVAVDDRLHRAPVRRQQLEGAAGVRAVGHRDELPRHDGVQLGEAVEARRVGLREHAERPVAVIDDDHGAMRPLVDQPEGVDDRVVGRERDRRLVQRVAALDVLDHRADDVEGDVLGQDGDAAAASDGLGHAAAGDGGHVGDDDRQRRADAVRCRQVDVEA